MNIGTLSFELYLRFFPDDHYETVDIFLLEQYNQSQSVLHTLERQLKINSQKLFLTYPINLAQSYQLTINPFNSSNNFVIENLVYKDKENKSISLLPEKKFYKICGPLQISTGILGASLDNTAVQDNGKPFIKHLYYTFIEKLCIDYVTGNYSFTFKIKL